MVDQVSSNGVEDVEFSMCVVRAFTLASEGIAEEVWLVGGLSREFADGSVELLNWPKSSGWAPGVIPATTTSSMAKKSRLPLRKSSTLL